MNRRIAISIFFSCIFLSALAQIVKPTILISSLHDDKKSSAGVCDSYYNAVIRAGGVPLIMPVVLDSTIINDYMKLANGIIIIGGYDLSPNYYGEKAHGKLGYTSSRQDSADILLIHSIIERKIPMLAICRGAQVVNVVLGGSLYQDIPTQIPNSNINHQQHEPKIEPTHVISLRQKSKLREILGDIDSISVNSSHHQSIKSIADGLTISAKTKDGVIEGFESSDGLIICTQFHPEQLADNPNSIMIRFFEDLVKRAKRH